MVAATTATLPNRPRLARKQAATVQGDRLLHAFRRLCGLLDRPYSEAEIRAVAPTPTHGMDVASLTRSAERLGFISKVERVDRRRLERMPPPFLLVGARAGEAWLVEGRAGDNLALIDPLGGEISARPIAELAREAHEAVLLRARPAETGKGLWHGAIASRLRPVLWEIGLASVVINLLALATPIFLMTVYNKVINHGALATLDVLALGMISLFAFELLLRAVRGYVAGHTGARLEAAIGSEVMHHLIRLPYRVFESMPTGQLLERLRQLDSLRQFFTSQMPLLLVDLLFVGLFVAMLFVLAPVLAWITLGAMPVLVLISAIVHRRQKRLVGESFAAAAGKSSVVGEAVTHALAIKALGLEPEIERRFDERLAESAWTAFRVSKLNSIVGSTGQVLQNAAALLIVYVGARMIINGELSIGALVAGTILATRALAPMRQIVGAWHQLQTVRDSFERLDELMRQPTERTQGAIASGLAIKGHIRFDDVTYRYTNDGEAALDRVDLEIEPGTCVGVIGPPGSGKSTLAKLILGLDRPEHGRVLLDDFDVRLLSPASFRQQVGVVPQEVQLFSGSIAENVAMGAHDGSFERIIAAAKFVGLHDVIQRLPKGYETPLGERGLGLSAGQRQLITVARALVRNPRVLILDEATSALDVASEEYLLRNLKRASRGRTLVIITHRLSALSVADRVVYLDRGRIDRIGPPSEIAGYARGRLGRRPELTAV